MRTYKVSWLLDGDKKPRKAAGLSAYELSPFLNGLAQNPKLKSVEVFGYADGGLEK